MPNIFGTFYLFKKKENRVIIGQLFCHNKIKYNTLCNTIFKNFLTLFLFITILLDQGGGMGIVGNLRPMPWHPVSAGENGGNALILPSSFLPLFMGYLAAVLQTQLRI
jgi:hypothetical protein